MLQPGLYEQVINEEIGGELDALPAQRRATAAIDKAEASQVLAQYLASVAQKGLDALVDKGGDVSAQIGLVNQLIQTIEHTTQEADFAPLCVDGRAEQLLALLRENDPALVMGRTAGDLPRPETSLARSSLFTGALNEPQMFSELKKEIACADRIDMLVSFIKWSGLRLILEELRAFTQSGGWLRVISTSYMGATDPKAIEELNRLLFVAHREEILRQSRYTFQNILRDPNFGELFVGGSRPENLDHLFVSIQTVNSQELYNRLPADYYDYIVVDEFHHAAAPTYQRLLDHFQPQLLLGLTATPERMDGKTDIILNYFGGRIAAEIRLPEAIDRKLLCTFQYFGVADTVDLDELRWVRGGYDKNDLTNLYSLNCAVAERRAGHILQSLDHYVTDMDAVKGLGFCVSVEHARFMADYFNEHGVPSLCLVGQSSDDERYTAKKRLVGGELRFLFVVDIYNEGVDIPEVNTVLFLRPTESLTVFLQQLGRGLRLSEDKECLTVLDFIGQANRKYNFEEKFAALLSNTNHSVQYELKHGFISAPKGCYIQLEKKPTQVILDSIKNSFGLRAGLVGRIRTFEEDTELTLNLSNFTRYYHLDVRTLYTKASFSRLCVAAGVKPDFDEPAETALTRAFGRLAALDSRRWISFLLDILPRLDNVDFSTLPPIERRMLQMFYVTVWGKAADDWRDEEVLSNLYSLSDSPVLLAELLELLRLRFDAIDFLDQPVDLGFDCPLDVHCTYTRDQLLVALDFNKPATVREGVKWLPDKQLDVFFVTLNKADKDYSPTTMYKDYSINETLFHWQSQSTTTPNSSKGQRYIHHREMGTKVLLFVRELKTDLAGTAPYTFLGTANYVKHEGSRPMSITWKLDVPIPAKYLKKTNKLVVG